MAGPPEDALCDDALIPEIRAKMNASALGK